MKRFILLVLVVGLLFREAGAKSAQDPTKDLLKAGTKAPDFTLPLLSGDKATLSTVVKKNKVTLLNFWATWCPPCIEELPRLNKLAAKFGKKGFGVIATNVGGTREDVARFWAKNKLTLRSAYNGDLVSAKYHINVIPCNYLIGKNGKIIAAMIGYQEKEILAALKKAGIKE